MDYTLDELSDVARKILDEARRRRASESSDHATLITFSGDLGAGKTTLIQEIARQLCITETLQSPTFVIYKRYSVDPLHVSGEGGSHSELGEDWKYLIHGDMYRLESANDIEKLGWESLLADPENIICIEWPEKIADAIPDWASQVILLHQGENLRFFDMKHKM